MGKFINEVGNTYGRLTVLEQGPSVKYSNKPVVMWVCKCVCGSIRVTSGGSLRYGSTRSCGCLSADTAVRVHTKHGHSRRSNSSKTYHTWESMLSRCTCKTDPRYTTYGGIGIDVCDKWRKFENFLEDMGEKPEGLTLDRVDNNLGYSKENCRWATTMEQVLNRRCSIWVVRGGVRKVLKHWCLELSLNYSRALRMVKEGTDPNEVPSKLLASKLK